MYSKYYLVLKAEKKKIISTCRLLLLFARGGGADMETRIER